MTHGARRRRSGVHRRLARDAQARWRAISLILVLSLLAVPLALLVPVPLKLAVDSVIGDKPVPGLLDPLLPEAVERSDSALLVACAVLFFGVAALTQLQAVATLLLSTWTGERLVLDFRRRLFHHVQRLSLAFHDARGTTDSVYRIQYDAPAIQHIAVDGVIPLVTSAFTLLGMLYVTALIDAQLALIALAVVPVLLAIMRFYRWRLRDRWAEAKELESRTMSVVTEVLGALRVVKAFGQEDREHRRFSERSVTEMRARLRLTRDEGAFGLLISATTGAGMAAVLFVGVRHVQSGQLTLGELLIVLGYLQQVYIPLETMSKKIADLQASLASAERAYALLEEEHEVPEAPHPRPLRRAIGAVQFRSVTFGYDPERPVLRDVTLGVPPGTRVGIAGTTGAGKTTLMSLLVRFYDPDTGRIELDGVDLRELRLADLRNQFAIVLQEPVLFSASLEENIRYGRPDATDEAVREAARAANVHDVIEGLPEGYRTEVGERGMRLSGGERQRVSLARAFLKDAPILVLDEPTSSVDPRTEGLIMDAMERLMAGRTTFMIAHRLSTLETCDIRLRIDDGRVRLDGTPVLPPSPPAPAPAAIPARGPRPFGAWLRELVRGDAR